MCICTYVSIVYALMKHVNGWWAAFVSMLLEWGSQSTDNFGVW